MNQLTQSQAMDRLNKMKKSLAEWLKYQSLLEKAARGQIPAKMPPADIKTYLAGRSNKAERALASKLYELVVSVNGEDGLPDPSTPGAAKTLAEMVVTDRLPQKSELEGVWEAAAAVPPIVWIAAAGTIVLLYTIHNVADVAKEQAHYDCIKVGACSDTGLWLKWGVGLVGAYILATQTAIGKRFLKKINL